VRNMERKYKRSDGWALTFRCRSGRCGALGTLMACPLSARLLRLLRGPLVRTLLALRLDCLLGVVGHPTRISNHLRHDHCRPVYQPA
jgi:hypothetical protein